MAVESNTVTGLFNDRDTPSALTNPLPNAGTTKAT